VTFDDGGTGTGSFTFEADTSGVPTWSITVAGGDTIVFPSYTADPSNSVAASTPTTFLQFSFTPGIGAIEFELLSPMTNLGGTVLIDTSPTSSSIGTDFSGLNSRHIVAGCLTTTDSSCPVNVPEPPALLLLGSGLAGLGAALRLRFRS
jgi:hypothetical protein